MSRSWLVVMLIGWFTLTAAPSGGQELGPLAGGSSSGSGLSGSGLSSSAIPAGGRLQDERPGSGGANGRLPRLQVADLETYYVPDKDGRLIPVFQFPFEEFERLLQRDLDQRQPATPLTNTFRVVRARFDGAVDDQDSQLTLRVRLGLVLQQETWQQIPLGFPGWVLAGAVRGPESLRHTVTRNDSGGLVLNVSGPTNEVLEFDLTLSRRVQQFGDIRQAEFAFPHTTETQFRLVIPRPGVNVRGGFVTDLQTEPAGEATVVQVRELSERSVIAWQATPLETESFPVKARVESALRVQALGVGRWQVTAMVDLNPLGPAVANVMIALPAAANNLTVQPSSVRWERLSSEEVRPATAAATDGGQTYRLVFDTPVSEATQIQVTYFLSEDPAEGQAEARVGLRGPQFLDCAFVTGSLELIRDRELSTEWEAGPGMALSSAVRDSLNSTLFNLERQDFLLELTNRPQAAQVRVESDYTLTMLSNKSVLMTVNFRCQIQGKFTEPLWIDLQQWRYVSGGSGMQLRDQQLMVDPTAPAIGSSGELLFHCVLEREIQNEIDLDLPKLQGTAALVQQPGRVILVIDDPSREFRFDAQASSLVRDAAQPARFRARDVEQNLRLRGTLAFRPRRVLVDQWVQISPTTSADPAGRDVTPVQHHVVLDVAHQPLPGLHFLLPATTPLPQLQVQLGNELLQFKSTLVQVAGQDFYAIEFPTSPERLIDRLPFIVSHLVPAPEVGPDGSLTRSSEIPLLQILTEPVSRLASLSDAEELQRFLSEQVAGFQLQSRHVRTPVMANRRDELQADPWGPLREVARDERWVVWSTTGPWPLRVQVQSRELNVAARETTIDDITVRTWWSDRQRREQMRVKGRTPHTELAVDIPAGVDVRRVVVGGESVVFVPDPAAGRILVTLPTALELTSVEAVDPVPEAGDNPRAMTAEQRTEFDIEIWYVRQQAIGWWTRASLELPRFPNQEWCPRFAWELAVSDTWLLAWVSPELTWVVAPPSEEAVLATAPNPSVTPSPSRLVFLGGQEPAGQGLIFISRPWFRSLTMLGMAGGVLLAWWFSLYRQAWFWLGVALAAIWVPWHWPQIGGDMAPWAAASLVTALMVVWWEQSWRQPPKFVDAEDMAEHTTRTFWRDASSLKERSHSSAVGSSASAGEPST